jgi:uncharacterized integral membrane protein (TIGR00698 family)
VSQGNGKNAMKIIAGILLCALVAFPAWLLGRALPVIGSPVLGILSGMILAFWKRPGIFESGITYSSKKLLQYSIILIGFDMNLFNVFNTGRVTLLLMVFTLTAVFLSAYFIGKLLEVKKNANILIGVGTAICGGSAIAAAAPVIGADNEDVASAVSTIFLFNVIAAFLFPLIGHILNMSDYNFGLWAGTAINDTSSVVAAGYTYSDAAGNLAVIVKLTRTLMIIPITLVLALYVSGKRKQEAGTQGFSFVRIIPWFVLCFIAASIISTFTPIPAEIKKTLVQAGKFIIIMAMAGIGLNTNIIKLVKNGLRPILLGMSCWLILAVTSILVQKAIM